MHRFDRLTLEFAGADVGLVGDDNDAKPGIFQGRNCFDHARQKFKVLEIHRSVGFPIADKRPIDYAIPVKEHGAAQGRFATLSHLFSCNMILG
jgi:hypothetical protein